jgi:MFS transporter, DHA1 family, multidrug resistance protein
VTAPATALSRMRAARLVIIIGSLSAFAPLSIDMYLPAFPAISSDLGAAASQVQLTLTACLIGLAVGQLTAGPLSDVLGRRLPLLVGLLTYTAASILCAFAPTIEILIVLRVLQGVTGAAGIVIARAVVRDLYSGSAMARFFSLTMMVNGLAPILAPIVGAQVLRFQTWNGVFIVLALIGVALFFAVLGWLPETLEAERRQTGGIRHTLGTFRRLLGDRIFVGYALAAGMAFGAMFVYIAGSPFVLQNIHGVSPQAFSLLFGVNALGIVIVAQVNARLVRQVGPRTMLSFGLLGSAIGGVSLMTVVLLGIGLTGILPALFVVVSSIGMIAPNTAALAMANYPETAGSASALLGLLQFIIGAAVAPLAGIGGDETAVPMAVVIGVLGVGALLTATLMTRRAPSAIPAA